MKRNKLSKVFTIAALSLVVGGSSAFAAVTTDGKWASRYNTLTVSLSSANTTAWTSGAAKWYNNTNFKLSSTLGSVSNYFATDTYVENAQWDGVTYSTILDPSGTIIKSESYLNTWAFTQHVYSAAQKAAVAAHELGHSFGLNEASVVESSSIMWPYSFNSSGQFVKVLNPSSTDISVVNSLYPALALKSETAEPNSVNYSSEKTIHLHPNWAVYYKDDNELAAAADLVVQGIVKEDLGSNIDKKGAYYSYYTDVSLEVTQVIKGDPAENQKIITVSQMGGSDGSVNVVSEGSTKLLKDQEVTLFLKRLNDERYIPINEDESIFVNAGGEFLNTANGGSLSIK
jgi:hypothetical protein